MMYISPEQSRISGPDNIRSIPNKTHFQVPFDEMWLDDKFWFPLMLEEPASYIEMQFFMRHTVGGMAELRIRVQRGGIRSI